MVVRPRDEVEAHVADAVGGSRFGPVTTHARAGEIPAVDDDSFEIAGRDVGIAQQFDHSGERRVGHHVAEVVRVDEIAHCGDGEPVVDGCRQFGVLLHEDNARSPNC